MGDWRFVMLGVALLLVAGPVRGQENDPLASSEANRVVLPGMPLAAPPMLLGSDVNPAAVGLVSGGQAGFVWSRYRQGGSVGAEFLGPFRLSLGVDHLEAVPGADGWRSVLGIGMALGRAVYLGFEWDHTFDNPTWGDRDPLSAGLIVRPGRWVSLGFSAYNMTEEQVGPTRGAGLARFGAGLAVRPGTEHLLLSADVVADRKGLVWDPSFVVAGRPVDGVDVGAQLFLREDSDWHWGAGAFLAITSPFGNVRGGYRYAEGGHHDYFGAVRFGTVTQSTRLKPHNYMIKLDLPQALAERPSQPLFGEASPSLLEYRRMLERMSRDPAVKGVFLTIRPVEFGWAQTQELGASLRTLKERGKVVAAYLLGGGNKEYYLAAHADHVVVNPAAPLMVTGIASTLSFYAETLKMVGIDPQFVRIGKYKSYPEPFERTEPTPAYRESHTQILDDFYGQLVGGIARARGVERPQVLEWIDAAPMSAQPARDAGMIDHVGSRVDVPALLDELKIRDVRLTAAYPPHAEESHRWGPAPGIAVLVLQGAMVDGRSFTIPLVGTHLVGAETVLAAIAQIAQDWRIRGVLVRIDSPGGSALAAERINRALAKLARRKPVVVSIGNTAASGGYYAAVVGERIFASSGSVTGSIGVWFGKVVISGLLDMLKVHREHFVRGAHADLFDADHMLTEAELATMTRRLQHIYDLFIERVAQGRNLSRTQVEAVAQGRVWTGERALAHKLVDEEGGCLEALSFLLRRVGIDPAAEVDLQFYPQAGFGQQLARALTGGQLDDGAMRELQMTFDWLGQVADIRVWTLAPPRTGW